MSSSIESRLSQKQMIGMTPPEELGLKKKRTPEAKPIRRRGIPKEFTEIDFENPEKVSAEILIREKKQEGEKIVDQIMHVLSEKDQKEFVNDSRIIESLERAITRNPRRPILEILKTDFLVELNLYRKELGTELTTANLESKPSKQLALEHLMTEILNIVPEDQLAATLEEVMNSEEGARLRGQIEEKAA